MKLEEIFDAYYDRVYRFIFFRVRDTYDAEDIASEVFVRVAKNLRKYDAQKASLSTWIFTIALNEIRRDCGCRHSELPLEAAENAPMADESLDLVLANEQTIELSFALAQLEEKQRTAVLLRYYGDMSYKEIARAMKLSETNVSTIISRSIKKLKYYFEKCDKTESAGYKEISPKETEGGYVRQ